MLALWSKQEQVQKLISFRRAFIHFASNASSAAWMSICFSFWVLFGSFPNLLDNFNSLLFLTQFLLNNWVSTLEALTPPISSQQALPVPASVCCGPWLWEHSPGLYGRGFFGRWVLPENLWSFLWCPGLYPLGASQPEIPAWGFCLFSQMVYMGRNLGWNPQEGPCYKWSGEYMHECLRFTPPSTKFKMETSLGGQCSASSWRVVCVWSLTNPKLHLLPLSSWSLKTKSCP